MAKQHINATASLGQRLDLALAGAEEIITQQQILRRIAAQREFGGHQEMGASGAGLFGGLTDFLGVANKVANRAVDLGNSNLECRGIHGVQLYRLTPETVQRRAD